MFEPRLEGTIRDGLLDGRRVARHLREQVHAYASLWSNDPDAGAPTLAVMRVGDDPASQVYVRYKTRACEEVGIRSVECILPEDAPMEVVARQLQAWNADERVDGILVQLPLPAHLDKDEVIGLVDPAKDVDGFHPANLGGLMGGRALLEPCTPSGVMMLFAAAGVPLRGKRATVVGRSVIVGRPMTQMLLRSDATVTVCHRHTRDLAHHVGEAEILVVAAGVPGLVKGAWVREGAVVIDVGVNRVGERRLVGDVEFDAARARAALITPVPGGVGPMTIAMLLWNTLLAAAARRGVLGDAVQRSPFAP